MVKTVTLLNAAQTHWRLTHGHALQRCVRHRCVFSLSFSLTHTHTHTHTHTRTHTHIRLSIMQAWCRVTAFFVYKPRAHSQATAEAVIFPLAHHVLQATLCCRGPKPRPIYSDWQSTTWTGCQDLLSQGSAHCIIDRHRGPHVPFQQIWRWPELRCGLNPIYPHRYSSQNQRREKRENTSRHHIAFAHSCRWKPDIFITVSNSFFFCTFGHKVFHLKFWLVKLLLSSSPWTGVCHHNCRSVFCTNKANTNSGIYVFSLTCFSAPGKLRRSEEESECCKEDERPNLSCRRRHKANTHICTARRLIPQVQPRCCWCLYVCVACVLGSLRGPREFTGVTWSASVMCEVCWRAQIKMWSTGSAGRKIQMFVALLLPSLCVVM